MAPVNALLSNHDMTNQAGRDSPIRPLTEPSALTSILTVKSQSGRAQSMITIGKPMCIHLQTTQLN
jgi:hypothetical protein